MADAKVPAFIFSSTAATFGEPERAPIDEDHPQRPINTYGETKLAIERALPHFERAYGIRSVVLRYFNAAGADPDGIIGEDHRPEVHLIPRAIDAILGAEPLSIFGDDYPTPDGTCLRDYVHVVDLADAHLLALAHLQGGGASRAYNLGIGRPFSVREVLLAVEAVAGTPVPHTMGPRRPGDPAVLYASARSHPARPRLGAGLPRPPDASSTRRGSGGAAILAATPVANPPGRGRERVPASPRLHAALSRPARGGARRDGRLRRGHGLRRQADQGHRRRRPRPSGPRRGGHGGAGRRLPGQGRRRLSVSPTG